MNRLTRDQLIRRALKLIDSPRLNEIDTGASTTPDDTTAILSTAVCIGWLQEGLDLAHNLFPMGAQVKTVAFNFTDGARTYTITTVVPALDFILDFKDGIVLDDDEGRLSRKGFNWILGQRLSSTSEGKPRYYSIRNGLLEVRPVPDKTYGATLYYYAMPASLATGTVPSFPSDLNLVEYLHAKGREWTRELPAGTAEKYMLDAMARLNISGLGNEADQEDVIPLDRQVFPGGGTAYEDALDWMGRSIPN